MRFTIDWTLFEQSSKNYADAVSTSAVDSYN
jgi:hypothetical protein